MLNTWFFIFSTLFLNGNFNEKTIPQSFIHSGKVKLTAYPQQIYIEQGRSAQYLNFDMAVQNLSDDTLTITSIEVSIFDKAGKLAVRRAVNDNGINPSIQTVANREIMGKATGLIYNPFHTIEPDVPLGSLRYEFTFQVNSDRKNRFTQQVTVSPVAYKPKTSLVHPLKGRSIVYDGHDGYSHHRRFEFTHPYLQSLGINSNFMRYSYDFCTVNENGDMFKDKGEKNEDWYSFGAPVYATGGGKIIAWFDGREDDGSFNPDDFKTEALALYGNYIAIDHLNGEVSIYGHLKKGSLKVKPGDMVRQGQVVAEMGASGSAHIPHLHYELRTGADLKAEGLPSYFSNFSRVLGSKSVKVKKGMIDTGDIIEN